MYAGRIVEIAQLLRSTVLPVIHTLQPSFSRPYARIYPNKSRIEPLQGILLDQFASRLFLRSEMFFREFKLSANSPRLESVGEGRLVAHHRKNELTPLVTGVIGNEVAST